MASRLLNGLIGYWKLDETFGSRLDSSGNGLTLTNNLGVLSTAKGTGAPLNLPDTVALYTNVNGQTLMRPFISHDTSLGYTVAVWAYMATGAAQRTFIHNGPQASTNDFWEVGTVGAGVTRQFHRMGVATTVVQVEQGGGNNTLDRWHLWVARYNGTTKTGRLMKDNVDGSPSTVLSANPVIASALFCIGGGVITGNPANGFDGLMSSVGLWNRELSDIEASLLWNNGTGLVHPFIPEPILSTSIIRANCTAQDFIIGPTDTIASTMASAAIHVHDMRPGHDISIITDADNRQIVTLRPS